MHPALLLTFLRRARDEFTIKVFSSEYDTQEIIFSPIYRNSICIYEDGNEPDKILIKRVC